MKDYKNFRTNLVKLRGSMGLSAKELAEKCGLKSSKRILDIEEGRLPPKLEDVICICGYFEQSIDSMLFKELEIVVNFKPITY